MNPLAVLELLEHTPGKNDKIAILKEHKSDELSELLHATFDFKRKFHMKKFDPATEFTLEPNRFMVWNDDNTEYNTFQSFMNLLKLYETRAVTGNDALQCFSTLYHVLSDEEQKKIEKYISKELNKATMTVKIKGE